MLSRLYRAINALFLPYSAQYQVRMMRYKVHITVSGMSLCGHAKRTLKRSESIRQWRNNGQWHTGTCKHCLLHIDKDGRVVL